MRREHDDQEEAARGMLQDAFGPETRLDAALRAETWRLVLATARANRQEAGFPDSAFAWLAGAFVLMAAWLAIRVGAWGPAGGGLPWSAVAGVVLANLAWLPVAAFVIVRRTRTWQDRKRTATSR